MSLLEFLVNKLNLSKDYPYVYEYLKSVKLSDSQYLDVDYLIEKAGIIANHIDIEKYGFTVKIAGYIQFHDNNVVNRKSDETIVLGERPVKDSELAKFDAICEALQIIDNQMRFRGDIFRAKNE